MRGVALPRRGAESILVSSRKIDEKLHGLATARARIERARALALGAIALGVGLTLALGAAQLGFVRVGLVLLAAGMVAALAVTLRDRLGRAGRAGLGALEAATARVAERLAPELGTAPSSAVDFAHRLAERELPYSRELAQEHLERTARALEAVDLAARLEAQSRVRKQRLFAVAGLAGLVALLALLALGTGRRRLVSLVIDPGAAQLVDVPLAADIRISYHYPAYTGLPERVIEAGDGSISAVVGTEVELWATADEEVRNATFSLDTGEGTPATAIPMQADGRRIGVRFVVQKDGRYHFALTTRGGDKLEERQRHPVHAIPDAFPEVSLLAPSTDVELRDDRNVPLIYAAKDDFGVAQVDLVIEIPGDKEPKHVKLAGGEAPQQRLEGTSSWSIAELRLKPGAEVRFFLQATDNDTISGPKKAVSASHKLVLFSAEKHHEDLVARQQHVLDALVDWLGGDLVEPYPASGADSDRHLAAQQHLLESVRRLSSELSTLVPLLRDDKLSGAAVAGAFANVREHVQRAERERSQLLTRLRAPGGRTSSFLHQALAREQRRAIADVEKDVIYLDDLLAIQRIDELKRTSKELLASQRELSKLLEQYRASQDPALKAELEKRIRELKEQMLGLLARMAEIKQQLPGEYRNLESASQLAVDDQLARLEQSLKEGNLDEAAKELERLADMIQNMSDQLGKAQDQFGGERYAEVRQQLADFAKDFEKIEREQQALAKRSEELSKSLREKTLERAGSQIDEFVKKAREKTGQALKNLDDVQVPPMFGVATPLEQSRQRLLDLDGLLKQKDFAESLRTAEDATRREAELSMSLDARRQRYGASAPEVAKAADAANKAEKRTREVADMLKKLFPDANQVLGKEQLEQMQKTAKRQGELQKEANKLAQKMDQLAQEVPLFGGEPRASLETARGEMGQAADDMGSGELPSGAQHGRRAADELGKLRQALEQASKSGKGGLPLPLAMQGRGGGGNEDGSGDSGVRDEEVHIPDADKNRAAPQFRKELMEAAKQKAPQRYEDAVRRYYEDLIR